MLRRYSVQVSEVLGTGKAIRSERIEIDQSSPVDAESEALRLLSHRSYNHAEATHRVEPDGSTVLLGRDRYGNRIDPETITLHDVQGKASDPFGGGSK